MKKIPWWQTRYGDLEHKHISEAINNHNISQGPVTEQFESRICDILNVPYAVATPSCSMAMALSLMALGVRFGDEVIVPDRTFIATAHAAALLGAKVVLAHVRNDISNLDVSRIEEKITPRTKVIIPVHLNGRLVDMDSLQKIAKKHHLSILEDAAQAFFSRNAQGFAGTLSDIGCFSFGMTKLVSTGQGGVCVTKDKALYDQLKLLRNHGVEFGKTHDSEFHIKSFNFKFTDILAAGGIGQLDRLAEKVARVNAIYKKYEEGLYALDFIKVIPVQVDQGEVALWTEVMATEREGIMKYLSGKGIGTERFLPDLHRSTHLESTDQFKTTTDYDRYGFVLPCGPDMSLTKIDIVIKALHEYRTA